MVIRPFVSMTWCPDFIEKAGSLVVIQMIKMVHVAGR